MVGNCVFKKKVTKPYIADPTYNHNAWKVQAGGLPQVWASIAYSVSSRPTQINEIGQRTVFFRLYKERHRGPEKLVCTMDSCFWHPSGEFPAILTVWRIELSLSDMFYSKTIFFWYENLVWSCNNQRVSQIGRTDHYTQCASLPNSLVLVGFVFEIGSHYVVHMGLELLVILLLQSGITDVSHPVWQIFFSF